MLSVTVATPLYAILPTMLEVDSRSLLDLILIELVFKLTTVNEELALANEGVVESIIKSSCSRLVYFSIIL